MNRTESKRTDLKKERKKIFVSFFEMRLIWENFLELALIISYLFDSIQEMNHLRVMIAARRYQELLSDLKYIEFMKEGRISLTNYKNKQTYNAILKYRTRE